MLNAVDGGSSPVPHCTPTLPAQALARTFHAAWRLAILALAVPAFAQAQEDEFDPPLITAQERRAFEDRNVFREYQTALGVGNPSPEQVEVLRRGARYHLYGLTLEEIRDHLPDETNDLIAEIEAQFATEEARRIVCQEIVDRAPELLPGDGRLGQPHIVRLNMAILLRRLNIRKAGVRQEPPVPFVPARTAMLAILNDPGNTRPDARFWAAEGLGRICELSVPNVPDGDLTIVARSEIGVALVAALESEHAQNDPTRFFPMQIMDSLGDCSLAKDAVGDPILVETLAVCLNGDQNKNDDLVRSTAALSLSRLGRVQAANGLGSPVNFPLVIHESVAYLRDVAVRLKTGQGQGQVHYRRAILNVYFAFEGQSPPAAAASQIGFNHQIERAGLNSHRELVESAYAAALPIFQVVAASEDPEIDDAMIEALDTWLAANAPEDRKITPDSEPLPDPNGP